MRNKQDMKTKYKNINEQDKKKNESAIKIEYECK